VLLDIYSYLMTYFADENKVSAYILPLIVVCILYDSIDPFKTVQLIMAFCMHSGVVATSQLAFGATSNWAGNATLCLCGFPIWVAGHLSRYATNFLHP